MYATPAPTISDVSDTQTLKQWAAEDLAITMGLLRECPYHGQPFKSKTQSLTRGALAAGLLQMRHPHPTAAVFAGNTRELLAAIEQASQHYGEHCAICAAGDEADLE